MEWIIGIYLAIGFFRTLNRYSNPDPGAKPLWMNLERDPLKIATLFTLHALLWPIT